MPKNSPLLAVNDHLTLENGVYHNSQELFPESIYDYDYETTVAKAFAKANSKGLFSSDFASMSLPEDVSQAFNFEPFYFLQELNCQGIQNVLTLSEDIGGIAHFLADQVVCIDSVTIDPALARLSAIRCAGKPNVVHICESLKKLSFPKTKYDLIILGQLERLNLSHTEFDQLLGHLRATLTNKGVILINAANQDRLSKQLNRGPHPLPYSNIYTASGCSETLTETTRRELSNTLLAHDFPVLDVHVSFSQNDACTNLFSTDYLTSSVYALNHFYQIGYLDNNDISEYLLFKRFAEEKRNFVNFASRLIFIAGLERHSLTQFYNNDFSYFPDRRRKPQWQTTTSRKRAAQKVVRQPASALTPTKSSSLLNQNFTPVTFHKAPLLIDAWIEALFKADRELLHKHIADYQVWLTEHVNKTPMSECSCNLLPSQILVNPRSGDYQITSNEWQLNAQTNTDFVLFRALFWFAYENQPLFKQYAKLNDIESIGSFILRFLPDLQTLSDMTPFAQLEQQIQAEINLELASDFVETALAKILRSQPITQKEPQTDEAVVLSNELRAAHEALALKNQRLVDYHAQLQSKEQRVQDLQGHRDDLVEMVEKIEDQIKIERNTQGNLYAQIEHLEARLHAQHNRNDELHSYLLMRPSTRVKRFVRRWANRLRGIQEEVVMPHIENAYQDPEGEVPFAELPEGEMIAMNTENYELWITENTLSDADLEHAKAEIEAMPYKPVFSILVPIYNTDPEYLLPMIESVRNQIYPYWQLCLVDDCSPKTYLKRILEQQVIDDDRISIKLNDVNQGISVTTNDALAIATGDYIALLDHDDEITIDALYENAKLINASPETGLIYSDEDKMELDGSRLEPYFKPDYSPDLLDTNNYICHFTVIKKSIMDKIGGFREGLDGSQDHDVILRAARASEKVSHIPRILYHWRKIPGSTAVEYDSKSYAWEAGRKAIEDLHRQYEDNVRVEFGTLKGSYRLVRDIVGKPLVSIIIPFKDKPELLDSCLNSILNRTSYANIEIIGVSNNSEQALTAQRMAHFSQVDSRIRFIEHNVPFNFSDICNHGVSQAAGDYVVLLNNDIEIITPNWIECMLEHAQRPEIGAVGCKLLFPDGRIQHAGVVAGMVGAAGHPHKFFSEQHIGYNGRLHMVSNVSAVTGAMLMISKEKFNQVGGLDAQNLAVAYNDIDLCLKLIDNGYLNVFTPHARATHHESISRGYEDTDEKMQRLLKEQSHFLTTWANFLEQGDPYYNPNMSLKNERFSLKFKE